MKFCNRCKTSLPLDCYFLRKTGTPYSWCKECSAKYGKKKYGKPYDKKRWEEWGRERYYLLKKYGLTQKEVDAMKEEQQHRCRVCGEKAPLVIDHDHNTGKIRGMLCTPCNQGLGFLQDNVNTLKAAIFYLEGHNSYSVEG